MFRQIPRHTARRTIPRMPKLVNMFEEEEYFGSLFELLQKMKKEEEYAIAKWLLVYTLKLVVVVAAAVAVVAVVVVAVAVVVVVIAVAVIVVAAIVVVIAVVAIVVVVTAAAHFLGDFFHILDVAIRVFISS